MSTDLEKYYEMEIVRIKAETLYYLADRKLDTDETMALISKTESVMSQVLAMYRANGRKNIGKCCVKTKLSGLFGKSCKITIKDEYSVRYTYYGGWLK